MNKTFNFYYYLFILVIILFLFEGLYHHYYYKISEIYNFLTFRSQSGHNPFVWDEKGIVENFQIILLFISIIFFLSFLKKIKFNSKKSQIILLFYLFALCYYFLEEISWGQHLFGWKTPEFFSSINQQNETNFHNTSNLLNELPRHLLTLWCCSFMILYVVEKRFNVNENLRYFTIPNKNLKKISTLILIFFIPDFVVDKFNLYPGHPTTDIADIRINMFLDIVTFNFIRLSELHELLFNYYILAHSYYLNKFDLNVK